jgi:hypothetical protein
MDFYFKPRQCGGSAALFGASPSQMTTKFTSQPKHALRRRPMKQSSNEKPDEQIPGKADTLTSGVLDRHTCGYVYQDSEYRSTYFFAKRRIQTLSE